jgi:uncharacterized protein (UPF0218 family)
LSGDDLSQELHYILPEPLRFDFSRPRAPIVSGDFTSLIPRNSPALACIGDVVSTYCSKLIGILNGLLLMVVDGKTRRKEETGIPENLPVKTFTLQNPPGTINSRTARRICEILQSHGRGAIRIIIRGEEDMLALPAIACSPIGGYVTFGIPGVGAALLRIERWAQQDVYLRMLLLKPASLKILKG